MEQLDGRVAVITGGGSGIGEGLAHACHAAGMKLVVSDIEQAQAERVAEAVRELGGEAVAVRTDVTDQVSVDSLADQAYEAYGAVHLLCSNAGVLTVGPLMETSASDWQWLLNVNLFGAIHSAHAFVPRMRAQGGEAHIAITASVAGTYAADDLEIGAYTASKYAVVGFAEMLRVELAPQDIGVSMFCPGTVTTRIGESSRNRPAELGGPGAPDPRTPEDRAAQREVRPLVLSPRQAGDHILAGVRDNRKFIFSHPERRAFVEQRHREQMEGFDAVE